MLGNTWSRREYYNKLVETIIGFLGEEISAIIVFGSTIYFGSGRDLDLLIILEKELNLKEKLSIEYKIKNILQKKFRDKEYDIHVLDHKSFLENLVPGSFLSGLALGYLILFDRNNVEKEIIRFLEKLSREKHMLINKYGEWNLSHYAKILIRLKKKYWKI